MKKLIVIVLILNSLQSQACTCGSLYMTEKYQNSDFIATAKILSVEPNPTDKQTHFIEIEILNLFKGSRVTKLLLDSRLNSSCAFMVSVNSTWLLFAKKDSQGFLMFGNCSNCEQIDRYANQPAYRERHIKRINRKLEFLNFIKKNQLIVEDKYNLTLYHANNDTDSLRGFDEKESFAVFEVIISSNLSIKSVSVIKPFSNRELSQKIVECLSNNSLIGNRKETSMPEETKIILAYFYYASDGKHPSFVTQFDL